MKQTNSSQYLMHLKNNKQRLICLYLCAMAGIYIHIPFCKKACTYCDFHFTTSLKYIDELTDAICKEIELKKSRIHSQVGSVYFGGGTPSVLPAKNLYQIFDALAKSFSISSTAEITLEANPDDLDSYKIDSFRKTPINRFSIGIQSFFDEDLRWMNRAHNAHEATDCIKRAQDSGFENLSIDLIFGYPQLSNEKLLQNIQTTVDFNIPHVSAYALTVEERTALAHAIAKGKLNPLNDAQSADQFLLLGKTLQANGYEQYEISNYSKPGKNAVHNTNYWRGIPYIGIGPSAHGFDGKTRYFNVANNSKYMASLSKNQLPEDFEVLTLEDQFNEYVMTSLRTMWGVDLKRVQLNFGDDIASKLAYESKKLQQDGKIIMDDHKIHLTTQGKLFADGIAASLFLIQEENEK